ncbi:MAG: M16 family metallopeptidase [Alphaproteobacteria bacterium]
MRRARRRWDRRLAAALAGTVLTLLAAVLPVQAAKVTRVVSPGGLEAWLVHEPAIPIVSLELGFRGGASLDPPGREGLAEMVSGLLDEGAGDLDSQAFQRRLQELAVRMSFDVGLDTFGGSLETLSENLDDAFDLLRLALTAPRFDAEPVERVRRQSLASLAQAAEDPDRVARRTWFRTAFPDHRYGRPVRGTEESVAAITAGDLRAFVARQFTRDKLIVGVVGDVGPERLAGLLDATFGALPPASAVPEVSEAAPADSGALIVVRKPNPQSVVVFGHAGLKRDDPDFYAAYVMNNILGGGAFTSRLGKEVREKRGLAYGVYTYLHPLDHAGLFMGGVATENSRVKESLAIIRREFARMRDEGVREEELADAKTFLTGSFPLRLTSNDRIARMLVGMQLDELGIDYLERRNGYIEAVTREDVGRVAARLLSPEALRIVVVGEPEGLATDD